MEEEGKEQKEREELQELGHEPVPGYRRAFYVAFSLGLVYLAAIFLFAK